MPGFTLPIPARIARLLSSFQFAASSDRRSRVAAPICCIAYLALSGWMLVYLLFRSVQPYPLDAFEEYEVQRATAWMQGEPLYGKPGEVAFPEAYPPLYFWLLGPWLHLLGESFFAARLLSLAALAGIVGCGWWSLRDAASANVARLAFLTALLSFHPLTAKFYEVAKPDALLTFFLVLSIVAAEHRSWTSVLVSGGALLLASLTKQNAPLFLAPLCLALALAGRWRWAIAWGAAMSTLIGAAYCGLNVYGHGHFFHWIFGWTAGHGVDAWTGVVRTIQAVAFRGPLVCAVAVSAVALRPRCRWTWCLIAALGIAVLGMSKSGGRENHLLPASVVAAILFARGFAAAWATQTRVGSLRLGRAMVAAILLVTAWIGLPTGRDFRWLNRRARETEDWVNAVRRIDGSVSVSHHRLLAERAGVDCSFSDLIMEFPGMTVAAATRRQVRQQKFDYLILEADPSRSPTPGWRELVSTNYAPAGTLDYENRSGVLPRRLFVARRLETPGDQPSQTPSTE